MGIGSPEGLQSLPAFPDTSPEAAAALTPEPRPAPAVPVAADADKLDWLTMLPFWGVHVLAIVGVILVGWSWWGFALAVGLYVFRMFGLTAGFHRYFSHRTFKTSRAFQFVLAVIATLSAQNGVLWWTANHRR